MKKSNYWNQAVSGLAVATIAAVGIAPAFAESNQSSEVAQGAASGLPGQCRATKKATPVYNKNTPGAVVIRTLAINEQVTLSDNGTNGFIGISAPVNGFVGAVDLKLCNGTTPPPTGNTCRRVIQPLGLTIRSGANPNSDNLGGVAYLERVYLTTTPATSKVGPDGRNWIQIARPTAGWVSNGYPNSTSNLGVCP